MQLLEENLVIPQQSTKIVNCNETLGTKNCESSML